MKTKANLLTNSLHLVTLFGFAFAQPLFDLLAHNAEFFVVRRSEPVDVWLLTAVLCFFLPALLILLEVACFGRRMRNALHLGLVALLVIAITLQVMNHFLSGPAFLLAAGALLVGAAFTVGYARVPPIRSFLTVLTPAMLIFPALFLFSPQTSKILVAAEPAVVDPPQVENPAPVVVIVFDEFSLTSLLGADLRIDGGRYPHFAALAGNATWFRNATTVHPTTNQAVPAILTGRFPKPHELPIIGDHPQNLFTLLRCSHEQRVFESLTQLHPDRPPRPGRPPLSLADRMQALGSDLAIVYLHLLLPREWTKALPPITHNWKDFGGSFCCSSGLYHEDRPQIFRQFLNSLQPSSRSRLYFLHLLLPHTPYDFLPSGKRYGRDSGLEGLALPDNIWGADTEIIAKAYQRHLLQVGYTDKLLGEVLEKLKAEGLYDRSLIILTADHGISFRPNEYHREVTAANYPDIMRVPLFIKKPYQGVGEISDRNVQTIDILPTLADVLGVRIPWRVDGRSALDPSQPEWTEKVIFGKGHRRWVFGPTLGGDYGTLEWKLALFGSGSLDGLYQTGPHKELIGRSVKEIGIAGAADATVEAGTKSLFADFDPSSDFVPAHIKGVAYWPKPTTTPLSLAVAVNGTIHCVTRTYDHAGLAGRWSAIVPESAFLAGGNELEVFVVVAKDGEPRLLRTGGQRGSSMGPFVLVSQDRNGHEWLLAAEGDSLAIRPRALPGCLDLVYIDGGSVEFAGWAADVQRGQIPDAIVVFAKGRFLHAGRTNSGRPDLANTYGKPALQWAGFSFAFPVGRLKDMNNPELRFFALKDGVASELSYPARYQKLVQVSPLSPGR